MKPAYAKDGKLAYFGVRLGDNSYETPEGYLVFRDAVIGRTGIQPYKFSELPQDECAAIDLSAAPGDMIDLYRMPEEVFSPETLASFEGKSLTDGHPAKLLTVETVLDHHEGHIQNIRAGSEPLDTGDLPMLADVIVMGKNLIAKIKAGLRELSCGYTYHIARDGNLILQVDVRGNHVAVVPSGRAGAEAALNDEAPREHTMSKPANMSWRQYLAEIGFGAFAKDAKPGELREAAAGVAFDESEKKPDDEKKPDEKKPDEKKPEAGEGNDAKGADRKRMHDALDKMMDEREAEAAAGDKDLDALAAMFGGEKKPVEGGAGADAEDHPEGCMCEDCKAGRDAEPDDVDSPEEEETAEDAVPELSPGERGKPITGLDRKGGTGMDANSAMKLLKPFIAASNDKRVKAAFDTVSRGIRSGGIRKAGAGYGKFAQGAGAHGRDVAPKTDAQIAEDLNAAYASRLRKRPDEK